MTGQPIELSIRSENRISELCLIARKLTKLLARFFSPGFVTPTGQLDAVPRIKS